MANNAPIGVFDSGIGGLTVVKELMNLMPGEDLIYFGDTARVPYGSRPPSEIKSFLNEILQFLSSQNIKMAVVACNAMTSVGLEEVRGKYSFPMVGVNRGFDRAIKLSQTEKIGVLATVATINSGLHRNAIFDRAPRAKVYPVACPRFVPLIEKGLLSGAEIEKASLEYLAPLKEAGVDVLILACTHYPFITEVLSRIMGEGVKIIDPARETAMDAKDALTKSNQLADRTRGTVKLCFSAGLAQAKQMAGHLFDVENVQFELVKLQDFG